MKRDTQPAIPDTAAMMMQRRPVALTIAGSDSGGGAGIQADLKTFAALGVHGASAIACLTAQNPRRVRGVEACSPGMLRQQIEAVFDELHPAAVKTGMLYTAENVRVTARFFRSSISNLRSPKLVVDPVLVSTSGTRLLEPAAVTILKDKLLPLATLVTPNLAEAEILAGQKINSIDGMLEAAAKIYFQFGCSVLVKGGHLSANRSRREATDVFFDGRTELRLSAPFLPNLRTHGTGCVYSAAICAALAQGNTLAQSVRIGKNFITKAIAQSYRIGRYFALGI